MPAGKIECDWWSHIDFDEKCMQKFDIWVSVAVSGTHCSCRLISPACKNSPERTTSQESAEYTMHIHCYYLDMSMTSTPLQSLLGKIVFSQKVSDVSITAPLLLVPFE